MRDPRSRITVTTYPERLRRIYDIHASRYFKLLCRVVSVYSSDAYLHVFLILDKFTVFLHSTVAWIRLRRVTKYCIMTELLTVARLFDT